MIERGMRELDAGYAAEVDAMDEQTWCQILQLFDDANIYQTWAYEAVRCGRENVSHLSLRRRGDIVAIASWTLGSRTFAGDHSGDDVMLKDAPRHFVRRFEPCVMSMHAGVGWSCGYSHCSLTMDLVAFRRSSTRKASRGWGRRSVTGRYSSI